MILEAAYRSQNSLEGDDLYILFITAVARRGKSGCTKEKARRWAGPF
ncbi:hypothetical protein [Xanthobacter sp. VNH20]